MTTDRLIDPHRQPDRHLERQLGVRGSGELGRDIDRGRRYPVSRTPVIHNRQIVWHRGAIGATGDAAYLMRLPAPSGDAAWAMLNLPWKAPAAGRLLGLDLWSSEARTAGTATARVRITTNGSAQDYDFAGCQLNETATQMATIHRLWRNGLEFAKNATLEGRVLTAGTFAPNTADVTLVMVIGYLDTV